MVKPHKTERISVREIWKQSVRLGDKKRKDYRNSQKFPSKFPIDKPNSL